MQQEECPIKMQIKENITQLMAEKPEVEYNDALDVCIEEMMDYVSGLFHLLEAE